MLLICLRICMSIKYFCASILIFWLLGLAMERWGVLNMPQRQYLYIYMHIQCMFCAYYGFNILIAWVGDGPWKDRLSPTCHRDSLPMASDQGIGLQAHLRLKCYPLRSVFVFFFTVFVYNVIYLPLPVNDYVVFSLWFYISIFRDCVMNFNVVIL